MSQRKPCRAGLLIWMCVMSSAASSSSSSSGLSITQCVIIEYTKITCYWKVSNHDLNNSSYRLQINKTYCESKKSFISVGGCETRGSNCSVQPIDSVLQCFRADVLASTRNGSIGSPLYFFKGVNAVKLSPPQITGLKPSLRRSGCLQVFSEMTESFQEKERDYILLQMEYTTHGQTRSQTRQAFSKEALELCDLYPGSKYTVRLRAQDRRAHTHWSSWTSMDTTTAEKAPSAAPRIWRHIQPAEKAGKRQLTLLWKPVPWPEVNGVVLSYSASFRSELDSSHWTCGDVNSSRSFCVLTVSDHPCHCSLTATNSAGTSPPAHIYIPAHADPEELPPPQSIRVTPLDDTQLKVEWTVAVNQSESGFVLQWNSVPNHGASDLQWEYFNETARSFILTGLRPGFPYNLSIVSLFGRRTGSEMSFIAFTREGEDVQKESHKESNSSSVNKDIKFSPDPYECCCRPSDKHTAGWRYSCGETLLAFIIKKILAAPSVGPEVKVLKTSSGRVFLKWDPVPLEKLQGFILHYTVLWSRNGRDKSKKVDAHTEQICLSGLTEGVYNVSVMAHTAAGGAAGPWQMVAVGVEDVQVIPILLCALLLTFLILIIPVCMRVRIKQCLCPTVPDPSKSSLSAWTTTKTFPHNLTSTVSSIISLSQATNYQCYDEKDYGPVQVFTYCTVRHEDTEAENKTYNNTSSIKYLDPTLAPAEAFPTHFLNQSYTKPDQTIPAGYEEDSQLSSTDLLFDSLFKNQADLCSYIHVSQSYAPFVTTVESYRTLEPDELPQVLSDHIST